MTASPDSKTEAIGIKVTPVVNKQIRSTARDLGISVNELLNRIWADVYAGMKDKKDVS